MDPTTTGGGSSLPHPAPTAGARDPSTAHGDSGRPHPHAAPVAGTGGALERREGPGAGGTVADVIARRARWCVVEGDSAEVLRDLPAASVNAVVTDPPAGIAFMGAEWDGAKGGRAQWVAWLASVLGLARVATVPGGRAIVWALPRTAHWTGCAVEDAGWAIESKLYHLFGTGWPKGRSQLKPSAEEWVMGRTGPSTPLNVDGCRVGAGAAVPGGGGLKGGAASRHSGWARESHVSGEASKPHTSGRWPPNVLLSHSAGCVREGVRRVQTAWSDKGTRNSLVGYGSGGGDDGSRVTKHCDPDGTELVESWRCGEGCPVAVLDAQSGESSCPATVTRGGGGVGATGLGAQRGVPAFGDTGTASRFFPQFAADDPDAPFRYIAKPSRAEKNAGCESIAPVAQGHGMRTNACGRCGRLVLPSSTQIKCECGDLRETVQRERGGNHHPTAKSIELMRWLVRLVTAPGDIVLDPFGGSGTTGAAALLEGRRVILVERDPAFAAICRARLSHAAPTAADLTARVAAPIAAPRADFGPLFGGSHV